MRKLIAVDVQREFDDKSGKFEEILAYIKSWDSEDVIATRCINTEDSPFVRYGNWLDCMGSCLPLEFEHGEVYDKNGYGLLDYSMFDKEIEYELIGYNTDACVLKIVSDMFDRGFSIRVNLLYCWSSSGEEHHMRGVGLMKDLFGTAVVEERGIGTIYMGGEDNFRPQLYHVVENGEDIFKDDKFVLKPDHLLYLLSNPWTEINVGKCEDGLHAWGSIVYDFVDIALIGRSYQEICDNLSLIVRTVWDNGYEIDESEYGKNGCEVDLEEVYEFIATTDTKTEVGIMTLFDGSKKKVYEVDTDYDLYLYSEGLILNRIEDMFYNLREITYTQDNDKHIVKAGQYEFVTTNEKEIFKHIQQIIFSFIKILKISEYDKGGENDL